MRRAIAVASFSGEMAVGPKSESWARRGRSGMGDDREADDRRAGRRFLEIETEQRQHRLHVARRRGELDGARVKAVRLEHQRQLEAAAGEALHLHPLREAIERGVGDEEERLERDERPLELHPFAELRRQRARDQRPRIDAARGVMQLASELAEARGDFRLPGASRNRRSTRGPIARSSSRHRPPATGARCGSGARNSISLPRDRRPSATAAARRRRARRACSRRCRSAPEATSSRRRGSRRRRARARSGSGVRGR